MYSTKVNVKVCVIISLNIWFKRKMNLYKHEHKNKILIFSHIKVKLNLEPKI